MLLCISILIFGKGYFLSEAGRVCSDNGDIAVDGIETCKIAAETLNKDFIKSENTAEFPKGCYLMGPNVFFNKHSTGSRRINTRQICKPKGTR